MTCPNCGYCPHCGRSNWHPWTPWRPYPWVTGPTWTVGQTVIYGTSQTTPAGTNAR